MKSSDNPAKPAFLTGGEIFNISGPANDAISEVADSSSVFDEDGLAIDAKRVPGYDSLYYIPFGLQDSLPFDIIRTVGSDEVLSQNLFFNVLTAYGSGLKYVDPLTKQPSTDKEIRNFMLHNSLSEFYLEQCTDMKYYFFTVAVIILDREGGKIVQVRHKDACYCRFEKADRKGRINHVFYANWRKIGSLSRKDVEVITLLNEKDPLGHLEVLLGRAPGADGETRVRTNERKFAIVMRFPTPGQRYYPTPYYTALFRGDWYDVKRLIGKGKKAKIRNHASVRYQVEIHRDYWPSLIAERGLTDPEEIKDMVASEKKKIRDFVTGVENSGKVWITGYYIDSYGKEQRMVRINVVDSGKEGGDWSEDIQEAANTVCYGTNIHPNLVGATPGKSQSNNSGSDKRELFTLKQSLETAFHDMLLKVHDVIIYFNGWEDKVSPQVPIVLLTTLDKNTDAKKVTPDGSSSDPNS
ncbi:MAG: hypothetical protein NC212_10920 [Staphylococcus sp.]|nr:hypothetical protein [Staphylococcus sp.]